MGKSRLNWFVLLLVALCSLSLFADDKDSGKKKKVVHKVMDPFWESGKFTFGPLEGQPMDVEFFRSARVVAPKNLKKYYGIDLKDGYLAIANVRGRHAKMDTLLGSSSHYIVLLPMDFAKRADFVSTSIFPGMETIRHSAFRFHFSEPALVFPQVRPKNAKNYKVTNFRRMDKIFMDTAPVDPKPEWTLSEAQRLLNREIYQQGSLTPNAYEGFSANWRDMKALTRIAYLPEEYRPPSARYVPLDLAGFEPAMLLASWINEANKTKYIEPYKFTQQNCYTDACRILKSTFNGKVKTDLLSRCRYLLSGLPLGSLHELVRLQTLGMIKPGVTWKPLPIPPAPN